MQSRDQRDRGQREASRGLETTYRVLDEKGVIESWIR